MLLGAEQMAQIHQRCFTTPRPWSADEIRAHAELTGAIVLQTETGFLLAREAAGEVELLTLAVDPGQRRQGAGRVLVQDLLTLSKARRADAVFLEVAADNHGALALYQGAGFAQVGVRPKYYGGTTDALVLRHDLAGVSAAAQV